MFSRSIETYNITLRKREIMLFRVVYSDDIDEHYGVNQTDTTVSMVVVASSFNNAMINASYLLVEYVVQPYIFEVVSVTRLDQEVEENNTVIEEEITHNSETWSRLTGIAVLDPDGWDRKNYNASWREYITREEFIKRATMSTCGKWPYTLLDEQ